MIVVDASIWIDHINVGEPLLEPYLMREQALMHPHILGEIALGSLRNRELLLARFGRLPAPTIVKDGHVRYMIGERKLCSTGIGFTDAHLLASTLLTPDALLWTRDRKLRAQAARFDVLADLD